MKRFIAALGLTLCAQLAFGQHPNDARGFEAGKVYNFNDVDTVNTFNGNLMVHLPIGPAYHVNGALSYQLGLVYNSHGWRFDADSCNAADIVKASPLGSFNAGFGWTLSLGRLFEFGDPDVSGGLFGWTYQSGDGADHNFYGTLHNGVGVFVPETYYARDGSYMRLSKAGQIQVVELSDGTKNEFTRMTRHAGTWSASSVSHDWLLTGIVDQFGNRVTITYSTVAPYAEIWTITDGARTTSVYFKASATPSTSVSTPPSPSDVVLDHIDTQMVGGVTATYGFTTQVWDVPLPQGDTGCRQDPISVTVLTAVTPPTGNPYRMTLDGLPAYDNTGYTNLSLGIRGPTPGVLTRLVLPTLGSIGWTISPVQFTPGSRDLMRSPAIERPLGVVARRTYDASNQLLGTWTYGRRFSKPPDPCLPTPYCLDPTTGDPMPECPSGRSRQLTTWVTEPPVPGEAKKTTISYFSNYESIPLNPDGDTCDTSAEGWSHGEHGLPFTRYEPRSGRFLSSEVRTGVNFSGEWISGRGMMAPPATGSDGKQVRATYVTYQLDDLGLYYEQVPIEYNATPSSSATYFYDDVSACGTGSEQCFTAVNNYGFDTYGHFRQASSSGNLPRNENSPGNANFRTTFTNYTAAPTTDRWLLNTSSEQCTADESAVRTNILSNCSGLPGALITKTQYDVYGALTARRILLNPGGPLATSDLLATFAHDSYGNLTAEKYYGGDTQQVGADASAPFAAPSTAPYAITHTPTYSGGVLTRDVATYDNANSLTASDTTFDQHTGLATDTRDVAGLITHYGYDLLGRVTSFEPPGVVATSYTYPNATVSSGILTPAKAIALTDSSSSTIGKISREYQYDPFGRLWRQKSLLPNDAWNISQTDYDVLGRKRAVSTPELLSGSESDFAPSAHHQTIYSSFDPFGRAKTVQMPDYCIASCGGAEVTRSETTFTFAGVREVQRTTWLHRLDGDLSSTTTEQYDARNRLIFLTEPTGTITSYTYDAADHLTAVAMPGDNSVIQHRYFTYDGRGFLNSETHPELGITGDGATTYTEYDARGHAHHKRTGATGGKYDLSFTYDQAERLTGVSDYGGSHSLKTFAFATANGTGSPVDYRNGKLLTAVRYNTMAAPVSGDVAVTETYKYADAAGRPSARDTEVKKGTTTIQSFTEVFAYDTLGAITGPGYPACLPPVTCSIPTLTTATNEYKNGFLSKVNNFGTLGYNSNGTLGSVAHDNGVTDTMEPDPNGMPRPKALNYAGWTAQTCSGPSGLTITAGSTTLDPFNSGTTLTASATACAGAVTYQWYLSNPSPQPGSPVGTGANYPTGQLQATTTFWVRATDSAGSTDATILITVNALCTPQISQQPLANQTIDYNTRPLLQFGVTGCTQRASHWYKNGPPGNVQASQWIGDGSIVNGVTTLELNFAVTTTVWAEIYGDTLNSVHSNAAVVTVRPAAPTALSAYLMPNQSNPVTSIRVTWQSSGADHYQVQRCSSSGCVTLSAATSPFDDTGLTPYTTYVYRVAAVDSSGNGVSALSNADLATTMVYTPAATNVLITRAHFNELLTGVNCLLAASGSAQVTWAGILQAGVPIPPSAGQPAGGIIYADHVNALRTKMTLALSNLGFTAPGYTDTLTTGSPIKALYFTELQGRTQ
jgi:YD repeat-containing protein